MSIKEIVRQLRKDQTPAEKQVWNWLRNRNFNNLKFKRQVPIQIKVLNEQRTHYIADFYCASFKLIIEIDGEVHESQKEYDEQRSRDLRTAGFQIMRFTNEEILKGGKIFQERMGSFLEDKSHLTPSPSPQSGEGS